MPIGDFSAVDLLRRINYGFLLSCNRFMLFFIADNSPVGSPMPNLRRGESSESDPEAELEYEFER